MKLAGISGPQRSYEWMTEHSGTFAMPVSAKNPANTSYKDDVRRTPQHVFSELDGANKGEPLC